MAQQNRSAKPGFTSYKKPPKKGGNKGKKTRQNKARGKVFSSSDNPHVVIARPVCPAYCRCISCLIAEGNKDNAYRISTGRGYHPWY